MTNELNVSISRCDDDQFWLICSDDKKFNTSLRKNGYAPYKTFDGGALGFKIDIESLIIQGVKKTRKRASRPLSKTAKN